MDTREKKPYVFKFCDEIKGSVRETLKYGDYQIKDHPDLVVIERKKSIDELCANFTTHRKRFKREMEGLSAFKHKYVLVEDSWYSTMDPEFSQMSFNSIMGSIFAFEARYSVHFIFANNRRWAIRIAKQLLTKAYQEA